MRGPHKDTPGLGQGLPPADRSLLLTGLLCALFGVAVFAAPLSTGMTAWQPLAGMVCMAGVHVTPHTRI